jgi:hypothetical protein
MWSAQKRIRPSLATSESVRSSSPRCSVIRRAARPCFRASGRRGGQAQLAVPMSLKRVPRARSSSRPEASNVVTIRPCLSAGALAPTSMPRSCAISGWKARRPAAVLRVQASSAARAPAGTTAASASAATQTFTGPCTSTVCESLGSSGGRIQSTPAARRVPGGAAAPRTAYPCQNPGHATPGSGLKWTVFALVVALFLLEGSCASRVHTSREVRDRAEKGPRAARLPDLLALGESTTGGLWCDPRTRTRASSLGFSPKSTVGRSADSSRTTSGTTPPRCTPLRAVTSPPSGPAPPRHLHVRVTTMSGRSKRATSACYTSI